LPNRSARAALALAVASALAAPSGAEDGYDLWLRHAPLDAGHPLRERAVSVVAPSETPTGRLVRRELRAGLAGLTGAEVPASARVSAGAVVAGTPATAPSIAGLGWDAELDALGDEGFALRSAVIDGAPVTVIASAGERGVLYGAFHLLRLAATGHDLESLSVSERPRLDRRLLNHWDNLDGSIERGYAGQSLWDWDALPGRVDARIGSARRRGGVPTRALRPGALSVPAGRPHRRGDACAGRRARPDRAVRRRHLRRAPARDAGRAGGDARQPAPRVDGRRRTGAPRAAGL